MDSTTILRLLFLLYYTGVASSARSFGKGEIYPKYKSEIEVCGNIRDVIKRNSARFLKILVRNTNSEIVFSNDDARRMTARAKSKLDVLASRVASRWDGKKVKVLKAWTDVVVPNKISLHYEGRAFQLRVSDNDNRKLGELAGLAVESGFDWVHYTDDNYVHASVIRDVCQTSVDLAFILDTSGSVGSYNFEKIKTFVKKVIDFFNIGSKGTHVAVVTYSTWAQVEFHLSTHTSKSALKNAVNRIVYRAGWTYTGEAIRLTQTKVFSTAYGMRPDKGIPKVAVLLTDGYSSDYSAPSAATAIKKQGINMFSIGVGSRTNIPELNAIASDPDKDHVFSLSNFNSLSAWVDKLSAVSCDEGASVSACDDTISKVDGGSFLYFRTEFISVTGGISVEVRDTKGISHLYASLTNKNPGPMDKNSLKNENDESPRSVRLSFSSSHRSKRQLVFVAVQGQKDVNEFKLSMWDTLFTSDSYTVTLDEEKPAGTFVKQVKSPVTQYTLRYSLTNNRYPFKIDSRTGHITTTAKLDHEQAQRYDLTVLAQDVNNACHKGRTVVKVLVKDINDKRPKFKQAKYYANINENRPSGTTVTIVTATDEDSTAVLQYRLVNGFGKFVIDKSTGAVKTTDVLDYEQQAQYTLEIIVTDGLPVHDAKTLLQVNVVDLNEKPFFRLTCARAGYCEFKVNENDTSFVNKTIASLDAADPDKGKLTYSLKQVEDKDAFLIDSTGKIILRKKLDRETKSQYNFVVSVKDDGRPVLEESTHVKIIVIDINDNAPVFPLDQYVGSVYENSYIGRQVKQVLAYDPDAGINSKLAYSLIAGDTDYFTVESATGIIRTRKVLDRESQSSYGLTLRAVDGGGLKGQTSVTINVLDANDNPPVFRKVSYKVTPRENTKIGSVIETVGATDLDTGINAELRYSILAGNIDNTFGIDSKTGVVTLLASLDYERMKSYVLTLSVSDRGSPALSSTGSLSVDVIDVNDNTPVFQSSSYQATVKENSQRGTNVVKVSAVDSDTGTNAEIQYDITIGNSGSTFQINQNTGLISICNPPSFKAKSRYDLTIEARDQGQPTKKASVHAIITIEDVNDNRPVFSPNTYQARVREDAGKGVTVTTVTAKDDDTGPFGRVLYSIVAGNTGNKFTIDGSKGTIKVLSALDRETTPFFALTIEARDGGFPPLSSRCQVNVSILDINDNAPVFNGPYTFHVAENKPVGGLVGRVQATDRDSDNNGKVTYLGTTGTFNVDPNTGNITIVKSLDYETQSMYSLTVIAKDHGSTPKQTSVVVKVIVDDVNDNPPKFPHDMYNCSVAENMARGAGVCYVTADDPDSGSHGKLYYTLSGGNGNFAIHPTTAEITTTRPLDREATGSYHLVVTAKDGQTRRIKRSAVSFSDSVDVYVTIDDENDNEPTFVGAPFKFSVIETANPSTTVGKVSANDADIGVNGKLSFAIVSGNTASGFSINSQSGVISVKNPLDRETTASYSLTVQARDSGTPPQSSQTVVKITVDDVNDNPPIFDRRMFYGKIREDASIGSSVLQVKASDKDTGSNGKLTYRLSGPGSANFTIDSTGFIKSATSLDYEKTSSYIMTVTASDSGTSPKSATAQVNITIINVNDNVPSFEGQAQVTYVSEDVAVGTRVVKLNATDSDGNRLTFSIKAGNTDGSFVIGGADGVISVAKRLDREKTANYTLTVEARDGDGKSVSNNATIRVMDVNDNKPVFTKSPYSARIYENQPPGESLVTVQATDRDKGKNAEITYLLTKGDKNKFKVDPTTGLLSTRVLLDREKQASYSLLITAKDHGSPSQSSVAQVTVTVDDVNDNSPKFPHDSYVVSVVENTATDSVFLRLHAADPDEGNNGSVSYVIVSGNTGKAFKIDSSSGELSVNGSIDRETIQSYSLVIRASDGGKPSRFSTTTVKITIIDENDNSPKFTNQNTVFNAKENSSPGTLVGEAKATDADLGNNAKVEFSILKGSAGAFAIGRTSGAITINGKIDRESKAMYSLTIRATDNGSPAMFTDKVFTINIEDVNDNPPVFAKLTYKVSIAENATLNTPVVTVNSTDADAGSNAMVRYQIVSGNTKDAFTINPQTGVVSTNTSLDYETIATYTLKISATDTKFTAFTNVIIDVININDNSPKFTQKTYTDSVQENSALLTSVAQVSATDKDSFGGLVYSLNTSDVDSDKFNIDPSSGLISTAQSLDREVKDTYVIHVIVKDQGVPQLSDVATVTIKVTDVNDNPPQFDQSSFSVDVLENITAGTSVFQAQATDRDMGTNGKISYSLSQQGSAFTIETSSGIVRTNTKLDRETTPGYTLEYTATDHGNPSLSKSVSLRVTLLDVNDNSPQFEKSEYRVRVSEDEAIGSVVSEVVATDPDLNKAGQIVYSITSGNKDGVFIIGNKTGILSLKKRLDREIKDRYQLTVMASDLGTPPRATTTKVYITILDVNDNTPQISNASLSGGVKENEPAGTYVMRLLATDKDLGVNSQLFFELLTVEYQSFFELNRTSGIITTKKELDRETQASFNLQVRVSDMGRPQLASSADVTINVIDVDDNCPVFQPSVYNVTIRENEKRGTHIVFVSATDVDKVANIIMDYKIKSGMPGGEFRINRSTGEITVDNNVDRETSPLFRLTVRAGQAKCDESDKNDTDTEGGGTDVLSTASAIVYINVQDVNDNAPRFDKSSYEVDFKDIKTTELFTISATDDDLGLGGKIEYSLAGQTEVGSERHLVVSARDLGTPSLERNVTVVVKTSLACEAMVFDVTKEGKISTKTLCRFVKKPSSGIVNSGRSHKLSCSAEGNTNPEYRWMLNGRFVSSWSRDGMYSIKTLTQDDEGSYSCLARSAAGLIQSEQVPLTVYDVPVMIAHPENSSVSIKGTTFLECLARGDPEPSYQWYKNGVLLPPSDGIASTTQPKLVIENAIPQDEAWYRCLVANPAKIGGVWSKSAFLKVYKQEALVNLEIAVSKPHPDKRCHVFDVEKFKLMLNKVVKAQATFTNISADGMCKPDPCGDCQNGGICEKQQNGDRTCVCAPGWTGKQCTVDVNECLRVPCLNGACQNKDGTYECSCSKNFTGKNCNLKENACANNPCNNSHVCVLSELDVNGFKCVHEKEQIEMIYKQPVDKSKSFDVEKEIEGLIKSAPNLNVDITTRRRRKRNIQRPDYGSCTVRITFFSNNRVRFVLLCPSIVNITTEETAQFVCGLLFKQRTSDSCGTRSALATPVPPTTYALLPPMRVKILLFARDSSNKDIEGYDVISLLDSEDFKRQMGNQGIEFVAAKRVQGDSSKQKGEEKANVGLIVGLVCVAIIAVIAAIIGLGYVYNRRRKHMALVNVEDRAVMGRADSRKHMLQRNVSTKDITRSEKKFINQAFTDSMDEEGEDDQFMVEVKLPSKKPTSKAVTTLMEAPYYFDKIAPIEAEMLLDDKVPAGTFLVRKGLQREEYVLTVKCPDGGPNHRHLIIKHNSKDKFEVQFGSMPLSLEFDTVNDVIEHFQDTPIEFGGDAQDVILSNGCDKTLS